MQNFERATSANKDKPNSVNLFSQLLYLQLIFHASLYVLYDDYRSWINSKVDSGITHVETHMRESRERSDYYTNRGFFAPPTPVPTRTLEPGELINYRVTDEDVGKYAVVENISPFISEQDRIFFVDKVVVKILAVVQDDTGQTLFEGALVNLNLDGSYSITEQREYYKSDQIRGIYLADWIDTVRPN